MHGHFFYPYMIWGSSGAYPLRAHHLISWTKNFHSEGYFLSALSERRHVSRYDTAKAIFANIVVKTDFGSIQASHLSLVQSTHREYDAFDATFTFTCMHLEFASISVYHSTPYWPDALCMVRCEEVKNKVCTAKYNARRYQLKPRLAMHIRLTCVFIFDAEHHPSHSALCRNTSYTCTIEWNMPISLSQIVSSNAWCECCASPLFYTYCSPQHELHQKSCLPANFKVVFIWALMLFLYNYCHMHILVCRLCAAVACDRIYLSRPHDAIAQHTMWTSRWITTSQSQRTWGKCLSITILLECVFPFVLVIRHSATTIQPAHASSPVSSPVWNVECPTCYKRDRPRSPVRIAAQPSLPTRHSPRTWPTGTIHRTTPWRRCRMMRVVLNRRILDRSWSVLRHCITAAVVDYRWRLYLYFSVDISRRKSLFQSRIRMPCWTFLLSCW